MTVLRIAMAQVDLVVGDLAANSEMVLARCAEAAVAGAQLVVFPEMTLTGYPPEDLVLRSSFRAASVEALDRLAAALADAGLGELGVIVGYLDDAPDPELVAPPPEEISETSGGDGPAAESAAAVESGSAGQTRARNAAAFLQDGQVVARYFKHHLPNYGVFDENRYFTPGRSLTVVRFGGVDIGLTICEDVWQAHGPFSAAALAEVGLLVNINGSPYERGVVNQVLQGKDDIRLELVQRRAVEAAAAVVYVNQVGGQDELVFDGDSLVVDAQGSVLARAPQFVEALFYVELEAPAAGNPPAEVTAPDGMTVRRFTAPLPPPAPDGDGFTPTGIAESLSDCAEVWAALVTGTRDYVRKNGFRTVVLGMSGGIDSAVVAAVAADAIGGENVYGVGLPSAYSSEHSRSDAADLADRLGANFCEIAIGEMVEAFLRTVPLTGLAEENLQARIRGTTLMGLSNQHGHLVLATGNKSELSVGYSTIYGDAVGGYAPIKDVPKSLVWQLARWRNEVAAERGQRPPIPENSITKPPSAELRPGQLDSDSLPDYEVLDALLLRYVDADAGVDDLLAAGFEPELVRRVVRLTDGAEWKRRQYPPGPKISLKAFGRDRRLPITNRWREA
ncbi:MAG TPA: NAD+ synthase [Jatrophihabitans sp.]|nr:NAD+ synthase [Jatrophihabitans sp.]